LAKAHDAVIRTEVKESRVFASTAKINFSYISALKEVSGKHEITPIARQAADLTEGVLSCNAAVIIDEVIKSFSCLLKAENMEDVIPAKQVTVVLLTTAEPWCNTRTICLRIASDHWSHPA
jgi:hypothetical protein